MNHIDHRPAGMAAVDAVYPAARNAMAFPWLARDGLEPRTVRRLYLLVATTPRRGSTSPRRSTASSRPCAPTRARSASRSELEQRIREWARRRARPIGVEAAEAHRVIVIEDDEPTRARARPRARDRSGR